MPAFQRAIIRDCEGAAFFNGINGKIDLGASAAIGQPHLYFSCCVWIKRMIEGGIRSALGDEKTTSTITGFNFNLNTASRNISNVTNGNNSTAFGASSFGVYQWSHIGVTYDGRVNPGLVRHYKNGLLDFSTTLTGGGYTSAATGQMRIGNGYTNNRWWNGGICRLMFWENRVLTDDEMLEIFNNAEDPYLFDDMTSYYPLIGDANDYKGSDHGTIVGGVTFSTTDVPFKTRAFL